MQLDLSPQDRTFREDVRAFVSRFRRDGVVTPPDDLLLQAWKAALITAGWQSYKWPREFGGTGWSAVWKYIWERECGRVALPSDIGGMGIHMIGPILCGYGTPEQRARYLPGILDGSTWWCQGYSEPGAGSDLASLRTAAARERDCYIVNGEKIWTLDAQHADRMFCLTRTSNQGKNRLASRFC